MGLGPGFQVQCGGEINQRIRQLPQPFLNVLGEFAFAGKGIRFGVYVPGNGHASKIEHEAIEHAHRRHITAHSARRAGQAYHRIFPSFAGEFDEVFACGVDVVIVNSAADDDPVGVLYLAQ